MTMNDMESCLFTKKTSTCTVTIDEAKTGELTFFAYSQKNESIVCNGVIQSEGERA